MTDYEEENDVLVDIEPENSDFIKKTWRSYRLRYSESALEPEELRHHAETSNLLLKVFSQG